MTEVNKGNATHQRLISLLSEQGATYRVVSHEAVGKCEAVSEIRGTALGQGAKALVCKVKGNGVNQHVLAILSADQQADLSLLALVADPLLFERFHEIAFNAGLLEKSVIMDTADYLRIAQPELIPFRREQ
ncbi:MAG: YbaK/prolyl-tRNA synthetase associated domain-containing protein [Citrobacter freundii]|nr:YbaK/prolyl-tRNA synthetase associated domain-containing protein [Citrobacter freundii]